MIKDLRQWLNTVEKHYPEEVGRVGREIWPQRHEASALLERLERQEKYPALLFERVRDLNGILSPFRLLMNTVATTTKIGIALDLVNPTRRAIMDGYMHSQADPKEVIPLEKDRAPVKEIVWSKSEVDLRALPIPRINDMDGGPYLTPTVIARHPETGRYNLSWNRCMFIDRNHLGLWMSPRHLWSYFMAAEEKGQSLPVALVLGHHPAFMLAGAGLTKLEQDEYHVAGGVLGQGVRVVESETFGKSLLIPADAEMVLEGRIMADKRTIEGPFGEFTGYCGPQRLSWLVEITAVSARHDAILTVVFGGHQENLLAHYPIQAEIYANLKRAMPNVVDVSWVDSGGPLSMVISIEKKVEGEPMRAAMLALSQSNFIKHVIVVDSDIDPGNLKQVMWAVATRVQADRDVNILRGIQGQVLDPSLEEEIRGAGLIIDATRPTDRPYPAKASPPEDIVERVRLEDYFPVGN